MNLTVGQVTLLGSKADPKQKSRKHIECSLVSVVNTTIFHFRQIENVSLSAASWGTSVLLYESAWDMMLDTDRLDYHLNIRTGQRTHTQLSSPGKSRTCIVEAEGIYFPFILMSLNKTAF